MVRRGSSGMGGEEGFTGRAAIGYSGRYSFQGTRTVEVSKISVHREAEGSPLASFLLNFAEYTPSMHSGE